MERIGFVGLGTMGAAMAANLRKAGFEVTVWNRTPGRAADLVAQGAREAASPAAVAAASDVVVCCVSDTPDVEAVLFGDDGVAHGLARGGLVIDCSTISPGATATFAARLAEAGIAFVDAPVSGGSEGAKNATLTIMVGGEPAAFERALPVLQAMGKTVTLFGPAGSGQAVKAVNQVILAGAYLGVAEGMVLALKAGLDPVAVAAALDGGAARSWVLENRSGRMIDNAYPARLPHLAPPQGPRHRPRAGARPRGDAPGGRHGGAARGRPGRARPRRRGHVEPRARDPVAVGPRGLAAGGAVQPVTGPSDGVSSSGSPSRSAYLGRNRSGV